MSPTRQRRSCRPTTLSPSCAHRRACTVLSPTGSTSRAASAPTPQSGVAHLVGIIVVEEANEVKGEYLTGSTVIMVQYRDDTQRTSAGRQHLRLPRAGDSFGIVQKRVDLINCDSAFEAMAVP